MKITSRILFALAITLSFTVGSEALAEYTAPFPADQITQEQWQAYFDEVKQSPQAQTFENLAPNQVIVQIKGTDVVYIFTASTHPAYPAFVRRWLDVDRGGAVRFMRGLAPFLRTVRGS
jgi:hypothetical protein